MKKIKKGDGRKKISYPCMKMKISKRGTHKRKKNIMSLCENENLKKGDGRKKQKHLIPV
jgi:5-methylcytosine-specific restriction endonuclease McrA